jgi:hypothetical protein
MDKVDGAQACYGGGVSIFDTIALVKHVAATIDAEDAIKSICIGSDLEEEMWVDIGQTTLIGGRPDREVGVQKLMGIGINIDPARRGVLVEFIEDTRAPMIRVAYSQRGFATRAI